MAASPNGGHYQTLTLQGGVSVTIALQWAAPWNQAARPPPRCFRPGCSTAAAGLLRPRSRSISSGGGTEPETVLTCTPSATGHYQFYIDGALPAGMMFEYVVDGAENDGCTVAGTIDDPAANAGTSVGHAMLAGVNAIGAVDFAATPAFGKRGRLHRLLFQHRRVGVAVLAVGHEAGGARDSADAAPGGAGGRRNVGVRAVRRHVGGSAERGGGGADAAGRPLGNAGPDHHDADAVSDQLGLPADAQGAGLVDADAAVTLALEAGNMQPEISGTASGQAATDTILIDPFTKVSIADPNTGQTEGEGDLVGPANGGLSNLAGGSYNAGTGVYTDTVIRRRSRRPGWVGVHADARPGSAGPDGEHDVHHRRH